MSLNRMAARDYAQTTRVPRPKRTAWASLAVLRPGDVIVFDGSLFRVHENDWPHGPVKVGALVARDAHLKIHLQDRRQVERVEAWT
ncbi:hypothetical protein LRF89_12095 [Halorhodospira sp. 9621]|uniref:hypothetical protein n=1 Tax=Halorhodospira sp. 9621 TaxID=2899135 RepID=UPI001EE7D07F|nr:hypothetical protein [Halorhodospira sp. 9621]MCG5534175.1 hypothetical protein [Halorhodospira sp. 9621]